MSEDFHNRAGASGDENRRGGDRRGGDRRAAGRREDDESAGGKGGIGKGTLGFAGVSLLVGLYGGYVLFSQLNAPPPPPKPAAGADVAPPPPPLAMSVQFRAFRVSMTRGGKRIPVMVTPYIDVRNEANMKALCRRVPQVRAAITRVLSEQRQRNQGEDTDFAAIGEALRRAVNKAISLDLAVGARVVVWKARIARRRRPDDPDQPLICQGMRGVQL